MKLTIRLLLIGMVLFNACRKAETPQSSLSDVEYLHAAQKKLTDIIVVDIFSPPVASRVYVYPLLAAYEAGKFVQPDAKSITDQLHGFEKMIAPENGEEYDFTVAAIKAFCTTVPKVVFSVQEIQDFEQKTLAELEERCSDKVFKRSVAFGEKVAEVIMKRMASDNYNETRGMPRFEVIADIKGRWVPTPPDYQDGLEPNWPKMKTMVLDSANAIPAEAPIPYSEDPDSPFWKELLEVYDLSKTINDEQEDIAIFWDCNPFVSTQKGHLMLQDKKMTPGGHWLAICQQFLKKENIDFYNSLKAYALTSVALYEAFIACWEEKYRVVRIRPETLIRAHIDKEWHPYIQTPPFPAYTSGHSTISAASAEILTGLFGDNQAYTDTSEEEYGLPVRSFTSFRQAALEVSDSRVYGGIHFRSDCDAGNRHGIKIGQLVFDKIKF
ncbi:MAG: vanadium-dependent haloperoxidase [Saprospiraceae bacterium]|nr:vanadium-dependent haloperoxidase [Saprospiraceae bacterium]